MSTLHLLFESENPKENKHKIKWTEKQKCRRLSSRKLYGAIEFDEDRNKTDRL